MLFIFGIEVVLRWEHAYGTSHSHRIVKIRIGEEPGRRSISLRPHEVNLYIDGSAIYLKVVRYRTIQRESPVAIMRTKAVEM